MQEPSDMNKQAHMRVEKYPPVVNPDGSVTFRLKAPLAHCVQIEPLNGQPENNGYNGLGSGIYDLVKDDDGIWSVRTRRPCLVCIPTGWSWMEFA